MFTFSSRLRLSVACSCIVLARIIDTRLRFSVSHDESTAKALLCLRPERRSASLEVRACTSRKIHNSHPHTRDTDTVPIQCLCINISQYPFQQSYCERASTFQLLRPRWLPRLAQGEAVLRPKCPRKPQLLQRGRRV